MRLPLSMDVAGRYNYCSFTNNGMTYYAFIDGMEYVNDNMTKANYHIDYWHTYQSSITWKPTMIERMIIPKSDDLLGKYVQEEPIAVSKWNIETEQTTMPQSSTDAWIYLIMDNGTQQSPDVQPKTYGNHGYAANVILTTSIATIANRLNTLVAENNTLESLQGVWAIPYPAEVATINDVNPVRWQEIINLSNTIGGVTVKNKKALTSPYCYIGVMSSDGESMDINIQDVLTAIDDYNILFDATLSILPTPQQVVAPATVFGIANRSKWMSMSCENYPKPNIATSPVTLSNKLHLISSKMGLLGGLTNSVANIVAGGTAAGMTAAGGAAVANTGGALMNMVDAYYHMKKITGTKGSDASAMWSDNAVGISIALFVPDREEIIAIDNFFSRYGYAVNKIERPSFNNRSYWEYVKTKDASMSIPDAEVEAEEAINAMLDSGLTLWHSADLFKDYSQNNL